MSITQILADFAGVVARGKIKVADLTRELSEEKPLLMLPEPFGQAAAFSRQEISRYAAPLNIRNGSGNPLRVIALVAE
ncbi:MAG TPA: hypothetical protein VJM34_12095 [Novosphingobium sp.]|nr:hypothetical protein [Novosphingobium sp.]